MENDHPTSVDCIFGIWFPRKRLMHTAPRPIQILQDLQYIRQSKIPSNPHPKPPLNPPPTKCIPTNLLTSSLSPALALPPPRPPKPPAPDSNPPTARAPPSSLAHYANTRPDDGYNAPGTPQPCTAGILSGGWELVPPRRRLRRSKCE